MAMNIDLLPGQITDIFSKANKASAIAQLSNNESLLSPKDYLIHDFNGTPAKFHGKDSVGPKVETDDTLTETEIKVRTLYKLSSFADVDWDDAVGKRLIEQVIEKIPGIIAETYDQAAFGPAVVEGSPSVGFTRPSLEVDETPDSWVAALDSVGAGYSPNGWILDHSFKSALRKAALVGTVTNPLGIDIQDGFNVAGAPAYFRDLAGNRGVVGDFRQAVVATYSDISVEIHFPQDSWELRKANRIGVYVGLRTGFGVSNQNAFQAVTHA